MPRDLLLLTEMIDAANRIVSLVARLDPEDPTADRDALDAILWCLDGSPRRVAP